MARFLVFLAAFAFAGCAGSYVGTSAPLPLSSTAQFARVAPATNCPSLPGGTGILVDGDFSKATQPTEFTGFNKGQSFAPSWRVAKSNVKLISSTYWNVDGLCSVDLDGGTAGAVMHNGFATSVNAKYTVTFFLSGNGDGLPAVKTVKLSAAGQSTTFTWDTSGGNDARHGKYAKKTWTFTAAKVTAGLKFASLDPNGTYGPVIAGISVKKK